MVVNIKSVVFAIAVIMTPFSYADNIAPKQYDFPIKPFKAEYTFFYQGKDLGKGTRQLKFLDEKTAEYSYHSKASWLMFSDKRKETSVVTMVNGQLVPKEYHFERSGTGKDKQYHWQFESDNGVAINTVTKEKIPLDFSQPIYDSLCYHLQQRINLKTKPLQESYEYNVINTSGNVSKKVYQYVGEETLQLPIGEVKTLHFVREVPSKRRITHAWFAPEYDYLLVKLNQYKKNKQQFEIQLNQVVFE